MAEKNIKAAMIAAVSAALKYKQKNPNVSDDEVIKHIMGISNEILKDVQ